MVGASGSGKSTLLYLLGGLDQASSGLVRVDGKELSAMDDESLAGFQKQVHWLCLSISFSSSFHELFGQYAFARQNRRQRP